MQYFYRAHTTPDSVLAAAERYFIQCGLAMEKGKGDYARFVGPLGVVDLTVEIEGGHYTRVTMATRDVSRSELDRITRRFLSELHALEEPQHTPRGAY
jgi:hypothetical protein